MTPQFALILSFEGIHLLQRAPHGWGSLGAVPLDSETLPDRLAALRISGQTRIRGKGRLPVKLILPNEQIRYLVLPATQSDEAAVRTALNGATPYVINELRYDFETDAAGTHVAAVALETLEEAESFAREHGFMPLGFAAVAPADSFEREVFFGVTREGQAAWLDAGADDLPVRETGPLTEEAPEDPDPAAARTPPDAKDPEQTPAPESEAAESKAERPDAAAEALNAPDPRRIRPIPTDEAPATAEPVSQVEEEQSAPPMLFASRARPKHSPVTQSGRVTSTDDDGQPLFAHRPRGGATRGSATSGLAARHNATAAKGAESVSDGKSSAKPDPKRATGPDTPPTIKPVIGPPPKQPGFTPPAALAGFLAPETVAEPATERPITARQGSAMAPLALIAFLVILLALGAFFWPTGDESKSVTTLADLPQEEAATALANNDLAPPTSGASVADGAAHAITPAPASTRRVLTREEAERSYAATGVWQKAPTRPAPAASMDPAPMASTGQPAEVQAPRDAPAQESAPASVRATPPAQPAPPPPPDARYKLDENGFILATPEGSRTPSGAIVYASAPPVMPPARPRSAQGSAGNVSPAAPQPAPEETTGTEDEAGTETGAAPPPDTPQTSTDLPLNAAGIELGSLRPRQRPAALTPTAESASEPAPESAPEAASEEPETTPSEVQTGFDGPAPKPRPARPETTPETPDENQAALPADEAAAPAQLFASASQLAVSSSLRPVASRPSGFSTTVSRARAARAAAPAQPVAATVRTVRPAAPSGATASAHATQSNVLNLRQVALIGVYGSARDRRAHVRLSNGRIVTVRAGERLDGGRVAAIGTSELVYTKNGSNIRLEMPGN